MKKSLTGFQQDITCCTGFDRVLEKYFGSVPGAYKSLPFSSLGTADDNPILLAQANCTENRESL